MIVSALVAHAGSVALRLLADRTDLTGELSKAMARRWFVPVYDRGRVFCDVAVISPMVVRLSPTSTCCATRLACSVRSRPRPRCGAPWTRSARAG